MSPIGDNLTEARDFVTSTMSSMDILLSDARTNIALAQSTLKDIKFAAKPLQARGIYRAAQSVLDCYSSTCSQPKIDGRLMALYKLITQYGAGLDQIAPVMTTETLAAWQDERDARRALARDTLIPLIKFAGDTAPALQRLAGISMDLPAKPKEPQVSFESLMPDVTNSALRAARTQGKSVSVSYAADGLAVADSQVDAVRGQLEDIVTQLVRTRIASPDSRAAKGLPRGGHIDISATETAKGLDISVECDGETLTLFPKRDLPIPSDDRIDMTMEIGA